jgi:hypothetical protein
MSRNFQLDGKRIQHMSEISAKLYHIDTTETEIQSREREE